MMTHVVILYVLLVVQPSGHMTSNTYQSYGECDQVKRALVQWAKQVGQPVNATCKPKQVTEPVTH